MGDKQLLAEIDSALVDMPKIADFSTFGTQADAWLGRVNAILEHGLTAMEKVDLKALNRAIEMGRYLGTDRVAAMRAILRLLHRQRYILLMKIGSTGTVAFDQGMHFQYFDAIRGVFETATSDLLVVDQYLNEAVLSKFCVFAKEGVSIRLLGSKYMDTLQPAAGALNQQRGFVFLRKSTEVHDRFVFVDKQKCFLSGASFKDGPRNGHSVLTEIASCAPLLAMYESAWQGALEIPLT